MVRSFPVVCCPVCPMRSSVEITFVCAGSAQVPHQIGNTKRHTAAQELLKSMGQEYVKKRRLAREPSDTGNLLANLELQLAKPVPCTEAMTTIVTELQAFPGIDWTLGTSVLLADLDQDAWKIVDRLEVDPGKHVMPIRLEMEHECQVCGTTVGGSVHVPGRLGLFPARDFKKGDIICTGKSIYGGWRLMAEDCKDWWVVP